MRLIPGGWGIEKLSGNGGGGWRPPLIALLALLLLLLLPLGRSDAPAAQPPLSAASPTPAAQPAPTAQPAESSAAAPEAQAARPRYTRIRGDGSDSMTVMVYMCGGDIESRSGLATAALDEMISAAVAGGINVIIETGGALSWQNSLISAEVGQRFRLMEDGLMRLSSDLGKRPMTHPDTLSDFIAYCAGSFPANRYALLIWGQGGGAGGGFGYDAHFPGPAMKPQEFDAALSAAGIKFDFIGFDACFTASYEMALTAERHADYLIAPMGELPGAGWRYTEWLAALSQDPGMGTEELGRLIIDGFAAARGSLETGCPAQLSLIDLAAFGGGVPAAFGEFAASLLELMDTGGYHTIAAARAQSGELRPDTGQTDLLRLARGIGTAEALRLEEALLGCISYRNSPGSGPCEGGISICFPYERLAAMPELLATHEGTGMDARFTECLRGFGSIAVGGRLMFAPGSSPLGALAGGPADAAATPAAFPKDFSPALLDAAASLALGPDWLDEKRLMQAGKYPAPPPEGGGEAAPVDRPAPYALAVQPQAALHAFVDDGKGFLHLGPGAAPSPDAMQLLSTWPTIGGQPVSCSRFSHRADGNGFTTTCYIPALLNGERVELVMVFTERDPLGSVAGARPVYPAELTDTSARGLTRLSPGDAVDFLCGCYTYAGEYRHDHLMGRRWTVTGEPFIDRANTDTLNAAILRRVEDIYGSHHWAKADPE